MELEEVREFIVKELPLIIEHNSEIRDLLARALKGDFADKQETESRFDRIMAKLERDQEEQRIKSQEDSRRWEEALREIHEVRDEGNRKWEQWRVEFEETKRKWDEERAQDRQEHAEQRVQDLAERQRDREYWEQMRAIDQERFAGIDEKLDDLREGLDLAHKGLRKVDVKLSAIGARWGFEAEEAFRSGLRDVLKQFFDIEVLRVCEFDEDGEVFGRPDQVELDVVVRDGVLVICEIKSSLSKSDVHIFDKKVKFYEKRHSVKATRVLAISPMSDDRARQLAAQLGIQVHTYPDTIEADTFS